MKKHLLIPVVVFLCVLFSLPFFLKTTLASTLGETFLFLERMQIEQSGDMVLLVTPSTNFNSMVDGRVLKIYFPEGEDTDWCKVNNTTLTVSGVSTSAINLGDWSIDSVLPGDETLVGKCYQGVNQDYLEITDIGDLTAGVGYGLKISSNANLKTGTNTGNNLISVQLVEGTKVETISFNINLLTGDQVVVSATVSEADTITCSISSNAVNLGTLYKGGAYITGTNSLSTTSTTGYYWGVYGTGGGLSGNAGLYNSTGEGYLLSSAGVEGLVNLLTGEGFGMTASSSDGEVVEDFQLTSQGVFGAIGKGFANTRLFLAGNTPADTVTTSLYYGAKAGSSALGGGYSETLTYVCGGYIGGGDSVFSCGDDFTDPRDSQVYPTVQIGDQCWMAKSLNYSGHTEGNSLCYENEASNCDIYGRLYTWVAVMDGDSGESSQGVCPEGWHVPSDAEQHTLDSYLATGDCDPNRDWDEGCLPAGQKLKAVSMGGDNSSGFNGLGGGMFDFEFALLDIYGYYWSSSLSGGEPVMRLLVNSNQFNEWDGIMRGVNDSGPEKVSSVRCLRD